MILLKMHKVKTFSKEREKNNFRKETFVKDYIQFKEITPSTIIRTVHWISNSRIGFQILKISKSIGSKVKIDNYKTITVRFLNRSYIDLNIQI